MAGDKIADQGCCNDRGLACIILKDLDIDESDHVLLYNPADD